MATAALAVGMHNNLGGLAFIPGLVLALVSLPGASAHNWLGTPARAMLKASTKAPCLGRREGEVHAQVGPGQGITMKWATGHGRAAYIVVLSGNDEHQLRRSDFKDAVEEYLNEAPAAQQVAQQKKWKRYHSLKYSSFGELVGAQCIRNTGVDVGLTKTVKQDCSWYAVGPIS